MADLRSRRLPAGVSEIPEDELAALAPTLPRVAVASAKPSPEPTGISHWRDWRTYAAHAPFALVLLLALFLLTINVTVPWQASHEDNGLVFESAAINQIRFGLGFTKGQDFFDATVFPPVITPTDIHPQGVSDAQEFQYLLTGPAQPEIYGDHPALLGLTIAGSLLLFGYHFWAVRLVPIVFTLAGLLLFYRLITLLFNRRVAVFASLLFVTFPITAFYGRDVAHEAPTMCCELGMTLCYVLWRRSGRDAWLAGVAGCVALGGAYGWPMLFFAWILFALDTLAARRARWRLALATAALSTVVFALVITQIAWVNGWSLIHLREMFAERSGSYGPNVAASGVLQTYYWAKYVLHHNFFDFGPWTLVALPCALVFLWRHFRREGLSPRIQVIALFGLGGLTHILVFRDGAYIHDYWQFYLIPFYAALLGWGGVALAQRLASHPRAAQITAQFAQRAQGLTARLAGAVGVAATDAQALAEREAARQIALLWVFAALALLMGAPLIYHLYAGGPFAHFFPGTNPVHPLIGLQALRLAQ